MTNETQIARVARLEYRDASHESLPHVLRFSGGRSSAAMAIALAESGSLKPERGDVVLFANTSAEHLGTYDFAINCTEIFERRFNLPVFWYEFCTVEDSSKGVYARRLSFRLVKPVPVEEDTRGFRSKGEVFEEMLSFQAMLPNPHSRSCTAKLKLYPSFKLLQEWFSGVDGPDHDGHYADRRFISAQMSAKRYKKNGGTLPLQEYADRVRCSTGKPPARAAQEWGDFTSAELTSKTVTAVSLWGKSAFEYVTLLGLRADEKSRVDRVLARTLFAEGAGGKRCSVRTQPPGEHPYFPLFDADSTSDSVDAYLRRKNIVLDIPNGAGNCVFCFMKGTRSLHELAAATHASRTSNEPSSIDWWIGIEDRYKRSVPARNGCGSSTFGFFGVSGPSFADVKAGELGRNRRYARGVPACDCTD